MKHITKGYGIIKKNLISKHRRLTQCHIHSRLSLFCQNLFVNIQTNNQTSKQTKTHAFSFIYIDVIAGSLKFL